MYNSSGATPVGIYKLFYFALFSFTSDLIRFFLLSKSFYFVLVFIKKPGTLKTQWAGDLFLPFSTTSIHAPLKAPDCSWEKETK